MTMDGSAAPIGGGQLGGAAPSLSAQPPPSALAALPGTQSGAVADLLAKMAAQGTLGVPQTRPILQKDAQRIGALLADDAQTGIMSGSGALTMPCTSSDALLRTPLTPTLFLPCACSSCRCT